jgi:hypothetical protein
VVEGAGLNSVKWSVKAGGKQSFYLLICPEFRESNSETSVTLTELDSAASKKMLFLILSAVITSTLKQTGVL